MFTYKIYLKISSKEKLFPRPFKMFLRPFVIFFLLASGHTIKKLSVFLAAQPNCESGQTESEVWTKRTRSWRIKIKENYPPFCFCRHFGVSVRALLSHPFSLFSSSVTSYPYPCSGAAGVVVLYFLLLFFRVSNARIYGKNIFVNQANVQFINKNRVECVQRRNLIHTPRPNHYFAVLFLFFFFCSIWLLFALFVVVGG